VHQHHQHTHNDTGRDQRTEHRLFEREGSAVAFPGSPFADHAHGPEQCGGDLSQRRFFRWAIVVVAGIVLQEFCLSAVSPLRGMSGPIQIDWNV